MAAAAVTFAAAAVVAGFATPRDAQDAAADPEQQKKDDDFVQRFRRGQRLFGRGADAEAETVFRQLIEERPEEGALHHALASVLQFEKRPDEAVREFLIAARLSPEDAVIQRDAGQQLVALGRAPEAVSYLARAYRLWPDEVETCVAYGAVLRLVGNTADAEAVYKRAHEVDTNSVDAAVGLAACVVHRDPRQALSLVEKATGAWADVALVRGLALAGLERCDEAAVELKRVVELAPPGGSGVLFLRDATEALVRCGATDAAHDAAQTWVESERKCGGVSSAALACLAETRASKGDLSGALDALLSVASLEEEPAERRAQVKMLQAALLVGLKRPVEARALLETMTSFSPQRFERTAALRLLGRTTFAEFSAGAREPERANDVAWVESLVCAMAGDDAAADMHRRRASELSHPPGEHPGLLVRPAPSK